MWIQLSCMFYSSFVGFSQVHLKPVIETTFPRTRTHLQRSGDLRVRISVLFFFLFFFSYLFLAREVILNLCFSKIFFACLSPPFLHK